MLILHLSVVLNLAPLSVVMFRVTLVTVGNSASCLPSVLDRIKYFKYLHTVYLCGCANPTDLMRTKGHRYDDGSTHLNAWRRGVRHIGQGRGARDAHAGQDESLDADSLSPAGAAPSGMRGQPAAPPRPAPGPRSCAVRPSRNAHWPSSFPAIAIAMLNVA